MTTAESSFPGHERVVMPVAAHREGYGVAIGLPTVIGREGAAVSQASAPLRL
jgi:hypothetical protein